MERHLRPISAIGLYSDTSISGVEAALILTDGVDILEKGPSLSRPYPPELKTEITSVLGEKGQLDTAYLKSVENKVTQHHINAVRSLLELANKNPLQIDVIGFPGHTVLHSSSDKISLQIGNADEMVNAFGIPVVNRFHQTDLAAGGMGKPIFSTFFEAITRTVKKPLAVVSIGGISSLTYIGEYGEVKAFDTGPGNVLIDGWMQHRMGAEMDFDGLWAAKGTVDERLLAKMLKFPSIEKSPPKAMDRNDFSPMMKDVDGSTIAEGAATLTALTVDAVIGSAQKFLDPQPTVWIISGGGAKNPSMVKRFRQRLKGKDVFTATEMKWDVNALEAEAYAFLAARTLFELPITFPETTGVEMPMPGGMLHVKKK